MDTGWIIADSVVDLGGGDMAWTSVANSTIDDATEAACVNLLGENDETNRLGVYFDLSSLPDGATFDGIEFEESVRANNSTDMERYTAQLIIAGTPVASNPTLVGGSGLSSTSTPYVQGGATEKWATGTPPTIAQLKDPTSGIKVFYVDGGSGSGDDTWVRLFRIKVYYTVAASTWYADGDIALGVVEIAGTALDTRLAIGDFTLGPIASAVSALFGWNISSDLALGAMTLDTVAHQSFDGGASITLGHVRVATVVRYDIHLASALFLGALDVAGVSDILEYHETDTALTLAPIEISAVIPDSWGPGAVTLGAVTLSSDGYLGYKTDATITLGNLLIAADTINIHNRVADGSIELGVVEVGADTTIASVIASGNIEFIFGMAVDGQASRSVTLGDLGATLPAISVYGVAYEMSPEDSDGSIDLAAVRVNGSGLIYPLHAVSGDITLSSISITGSGDSFTFIAKEGEGALVLGPVSLVSRAVLYALMESSGDVELGALTLRAEALLGLHLAAELDLGVLEVSGAMLIAQDAAGAVILGAESVDSGVYFIRKAAGSIELGGMTVESTVRPWVDTVGSITLGTALLSGVTNRGSNATGNILLPTMDADGVVDRDIFADAAITLGAIQVFSSMSRTSQQLYRVTHIGTTQGGKYKLLSIEATTKPTERAPNV